MRRVIHLDGVIFNGNGHGVSTVKWPKSHLDCDQSKSELLQSVQSEKFTIRLKYGDAIVSKHFLPSACISGPPYFAVRVSFYRLFIMILMNCFAFIQASYMTKVIILLIHTEEIQQQQQQ